MIAPAATTGSARTLIMALGAFLEIASSYNPYAPPVDPLPIGKANILPETLVPSSSCPFSTISPVSGFMPPKNQIGDCDTFPRNHSNPPRPQTVPLLSELPRPVSR